MCAVVIYPNNTFVWNKSIFRGGKFNPDEMYSAINGTEFDVVRASPTFLGFVDGEGLYKPETHHQNVLAAYVLDWFLHGKRNTFMDQLINGPFVITKAKSRHLGADEKALSDDEVKAVMTLCEWFSEHDPGDYERTEIPVLTDDMLRVLGEQSPKKRKRVTVEKGVSAGTEKDDAPAAAAAAVTTTAVELLEPVKKKTK